MFRHIEVSARISPKVVEIGVGLGDLSAKLLAFFDLIAYEIDSELCEKITFPKDRFRLINQDVLELESTRGWLCDEPYMLVSNLPYYIATRIILNALKDSECVGFVVMTQKEVADKFCADAGNREFCALSVLAQSVGKKIEKVADVPPNAFIPPPKVESSVFSVLKNAQNIDSEFEKMLKIAFHAPRKMAIKNLDFIPNIAEIFGRLGIENTARAHQISTWQYHQIFTLGVKK